MRNIQIVKALMIDGDTIPITWDENVPTDLEAFHDVSFKEQMALMVIEALTEYDLSDEEKEHIRKIL